MTEASTTNSNVPAHVRETVDAIAVLHAEHDARASKSERLLKAVSVAVATPDFLLALTIAVIGWLAFNLVFHRDAVDPPPFSLLQGGLTLLAVYISVSILAAQRRANTLADLRAQLTLEHAILAEQKAAKAIALLEELRRDDPLIKNRDDPEAAVLSATTDTATVAAALQEAHPDLDAKR